MKIRDNYFLNNSTSTTPKTSTVAKPEDRTQQQAQEEPRTRTPQPWRTSYVIPLPQVAPQSSRGVPLYQRSSGYTKGFRCSRANGSICAGRSIRRAQAQKVRSVFRRNDHSRRRRADHDERHKWRQRVCAESCGRLRRQGCGRSHRYVCCLPAADTLCWTCG